MGGASCYCGDDEKLKRCGEGSACNSKADTPCVCTPDANQLCHTSKSISVPNGEKDQIRITAVKFGCWSEGERTDAEGVKTTTYMKLSCAAEGTNVVAETFTDDKCTVVATGAFMKNTVFTGKDATDTEMEDSKT